MQKTIKRITLILAVALAVVCMGIFASACADTKNFTFTVYYSDGSTVVNGDDTPLKIQICDATGNFCHNEFGAVNSKGVAKIDIAKAEAAAELNHVTEMAFVVHVIDGNYTQLELKEEVIVSKENKSVKVVLKDLEAPQK